MATKSIHVSFDVEINVQDWCDEYGTDDETIVPDVTEYCREAAVQQLIRVGLWRGRPE